MLHNNASFIHYIQNSVRFNSVTNSFVLILQQCVTIERLDANLQLSIVLGCMDTKVCIFFLSLCMNITLKHPTPRKKCKEKKQLKHLQQKNLQKKKKLTSINSFTEFKPHGAWTFNDSLYYYSRIVYLYVYYRFVTPTSAPDKVGQGR